MRTGGGTRRLLLGALTVAIVGGGLFFIRVLPTTSEAPASTAVLVAAHDLAATHSLAPADLATAVVPAALPLGQPIPAATLGTIIGKRTSVPLFAGQPLDRRMLFADTPLPPSALDLLRPGEAVVTVHALSLTTPLTGLPSDSVVAIYATTRRMPLTTTMQATADGQTLQTSQDEVTLVSAAARVLDYEPAEGAISLIVPRRQAGTLYLLEDTAVLHFALVHPDDHTPQEPETMDTRRFSREYHVPTQ